MKSFSRLFLALGAFLIVSLAVYGWHAREYEGVLLSITVAAAALMFGTYGASVVRRSRTALAKPATDDKQAAVGEPIALDEPHVGPTIWPLVYAISAIAIVIGAVGNRWVLVPGGVLFVAASIGWVRDVHQQWHHHVAGPHADHGGPDDGHGSGAETLAAPPAAVAAVPHQPTATTDNAAAVPASGDDQAGDTSSTAG